jgi:hypothetical protein
LKAGPDTDNVVKITTDQLKGDDQTILRTRGTITIANTALGTDAVGALGAIVLPNKTAAQAGSSEIPNPLVDADTTDWFVWQPLIVEASLTDTGAETGEEASAAAANVMNFHIDSKAKRIMEAAESVVWCLGLNPVSAVSSKQFRFGYVFRTLVGY